MNNLQQFLEEEYNQFEKDIEPSDFIEFMKKRDNILINKTLDEVKKEVEKEIREMENHECNNVLCPHYPRTDAHNMVIRHILTLLENLKNN